MNTFYRANSIRIAAFQGKSPSDIGKFRPRTDSHNLQAFEVEDEDGRKFWTASLPLGSTSGNFETQAQALEHGRYILLQQGWTLDQSEANARSIEEAKARHEKRLSKAQ